MHIRGNSKRKAIRSEAIKCCRKAMYHKKKKKEPLDEHGLPSSEGKPCWVFNCVEPTREFVVKQRDILDYVAETNGYDKAAMNGLLLVSCERHYPELLKDLQKRANAANVGYE